MNCISENQRLRKSLMNGTNESSAEMLIFNFDLEKTLPCPVIATNLEYYYRELQVYNLKIHNLGSDEATIFMWHEVVASRGPDEIGSRVMKYRKEKLKNGVKDTVTFSDSCSRQNRNFKMAIVGCYLVSKGARRFKQRFMRTRSQFSPKLC